MNLKDIVTARLSHQQLSAQAFDKIKDLVGWMGALQAQDYHMAKWAIGLRLPKTTEKEVEQAMNTGKILRTHVLRPTWHFVSPDHIHWMLELTAPHIKASAKSRDKALEITEKLYSKSNALIEKTLAEGKHCTREELMNVLSQHKIVVDAQRAVHFMLRAELEGIACSGAVQGKNQTYALLDDRVRQTKKISREEALVKLADIYFSSHAPATLQDFSWWSGLSLTDSKQAIEGAKKNYTAEKIGVETFWLPNHYKIPTKTNAYLHLLPAFDEFIISYKDRTATLALEHQKTAFSRNGIFRPVVLVNGQGFGLWSRIIKKDNVHLSTTFFKPVSKTIQQQLKKEAMAFGRFLEKKIIIE